MAVRAFSQTVTTTRAPIAADLPDDPVSGCTLWLYGEYHGSSSKVAIGGPDVTIANGIHLYGGEKFGPITLQDGETLYAVSEEVAGLDLRVLVVGA